MKLLKDASRELQVALSSQQDSTDSYCFCEKQKRNQDRKKHIFISLLSSFFKKSKNAWVVERLGKKT